VTRIRGLDPVDRVSQLGKQPLGRLQQLLAGFSQVNLPNRTLEERAVEAFLEFSNLITDRALGQTQFLRRQAETQMPGR